ncbi:MAG: GspE/PulE family protein, partial [Planctomycetota bacterium]
MTIPDLQKALDRLKPSDPQFAVQAVDTVLAAARASGASDVHWQPTAEGMSVRFRIDGVLQPVHMLPAAAAPNLAARLKVIAGLLTYRTDFPQEGRMRTAPRTEEKQRNGPAVPSREAGETILTANETEMRVSTFPTLHGERVVVRLFGRRQDFQFPADLGLPDDILATLTRLLGETSGAILVSGPAGSGKTTTVYACMRELLRQHPCRSLVSIEDPVEAELPGVGQAQVHANVGLDLATGLRFLMRQDPEVIMVGEIRDRATADAAMQASLTGHLLLSTFHAGSAAETVGRLLDMGIEPYVLRSGLMAILNQRLLRRL